MAWDESKSTFQQRPAVAGDEKLTADEWNVHVNDQKDHSNRHESGGVDEITVEGLSGDLADPQDPKQGVVNDFVDALVAGGDKVNTTYDSGAGTLTIDTAALDTEEVEDAVNGLLAGGPQVTTTYDDAAGALTISIDAPTQAAFDDHSARHEDGGTDELDVSGLSGVLADAQTPQTEAVQDIVSALLAPGDKVSLTYDDAGNVLTINTSALDEEEVEDAVAALVTAGNAITVNYDDANDTLTVDVVDGAIDHDALAGFVTNEHVDHSGVTITAGRGLTGGGDLTSTRTLNAHDVTTQTGDYTAGENDVVLVDASGGNVTITLPAPSESIMVTVKRIDSSSNTVTIATPGSETIDGESAPEVDIQYEAHEIVSNGTDYFTI